MPERVVGDQEQVLQIVLIGKVREAAVHSELERQGQRSVALPEAVTPSAGFDIGGGPCITE